MLKISFVPWYDPNKKLAKALQAALAKQFPETNMNTNHVYTFEALLIAADAYKRAGSADPKGLADAIRATDIKDNVSTGPGIRNKVRVFSFVNGTATLLRSFRPFPKSYQGGVFVAAGDSHIGLGSCLGGCPADILVGRGKGTTAVKLFDSVGNPIVSLAEAYPGFSGGVRVGMADTDGDGDIDLLLTAPGAGPVPEVITFDGGLSEIVWSPNGRTSVPVDVSDTCCSISSVSVIRSL